MNGDLLARKHGRFIVIVFYCNFSPLNENSLHRTRRDLLQDYTTRSTKEMPLTLCLKNGVYSKYIHFRRDAPTLITISGHEKSCLTHYTVILFDFQAEVARTSQNIGFNSYSLLLRSFGNYCNIKSQCNANQSHYNTQMHIHIHTYTQYICQTTFLHSGIIFSSICLQFIIYL